MKKDNSFARSRRFSSQENWDALPARPPSPRWATLSALTLIVLTILFWCVLAHLPIEVKASGIFLPDGRAWCFVHEESKAVTPQMPCQIFPVTADATSAQSISGLVKTASNLPLTQLDIARLLNSEALAEKFYVSGQSNYAVELIPHAPSEQLRGVFFTVRIIVKTEKVIFLAFPHLKKILAL